MRHVTSSEKLEGYRSKEGKVAFTGQRQAR